MTRFSCLATTLFLAGCLDSVPAGIRTSGGVSGVSSPLNAITGTNGARAPSTGNAVSGSGSAGATSGSTATAGSANGGSGTTGTSVASSTGSSGGAAPQCLCNSDCPSDDFCDSFTGRCKTPGSAGDSGFTPGDLCACTPGEGYGILTDAGVCLIGITGADLPCTTDADCGPACMGTCEGDAGVCVSPTACLLSVDGGAPSSDAGFGSATLSGTAAFTPNFEVAGESIDTIGPQGVDLLIEQRTGPVPTSCAAGNDAGSADVAEYVDLMIMDENARPGRYPVLTDIPGLGYDGGAYAIVQLFPRAGNDWIRASTGSVTLTQVGATYAGSFSTEFADPDAGVTETLSGVFNVPFCE